MEGKGFFASLFDISFSSFITTKIIKVLYVLTLVILGLVALGFVVSAFAASAGAGLFVLVIGAPLAFLLYAIYTRVVLEVLIAIFRIMETNIELVQLQRGRVAEPAVAATAPLYTPPQPPTPPSTPPPPAPSA